jgi:hypothetical protein
LYTSKSGGYIELSSNKLNTGSLKLKESELFLYLNVDLNKIRKQKVFPSFANFTERIDSLVISGKKADAKTGEIKASLYLKNKNSNALWEVIPF